MASLTANIDAEVLEIQPAEEGLDYAANNYSSGISSVVADAKTMANGQTLTERQKGLAACACLMAQGDLDRLQPAVRTALDNGVTINELKEAFSQLYAYTGFPRSLNALGVLSKVLENRQPNWQKSSTGTVQPKTHGSSTLHITKTCRKMPPTSGWKK